ncbi:ABC transporter permease [Chryseolinea sp. T2]|uniref:ABC transporter permease n=1 Tax=Chryseolinea sp. T2 TaxID=3129255 RepID=UPI00307735E2
MNLVFLVWQYLKFRPLTTVLNILLLGLGIAVITIMVLSNLQLQRNISRNAQGIDLVIGAKGSPMQLILSSIFHVDVPTGNIKIRDAERFAKGALVKQSIPLALGDSYRSFRIVGTDKRYAGLYSAELAQGKWWTRSMEATLGSVVATRTGLKTGDRFSSAHGLTSGGHEHDEQTYQVVGVFAATGSILDELILTNIESIWQVHDLWTAADQQRSQQDTIPLLTRSPIVPVIMRGDSVREITSLLIQYRSALGAVQLPRIVNSNSTMQAASPVFETARLFSIIGSGADLFLAFAYLLILIAGISIFIALYNSLRERRYDMAIMRTMGASRIKLFVAVLVEGIVMSVAGSFAGLALGHIALAAVPFWFEQTEKAGITGWYFHPFELILVSGSALLGVVCALVPAVEAYRTDISDILAENN